MSSADIVSTVSLVIAITALTLSLLQALQQFAATAEGYRRCRERIVGLWSQNTRRRFTFEEFRFKVKFTTPIMFVAHYDNPFGPIKGQEILNVTGDSVSLAKTHCRLPRDAASQLKAGVERIATFPNNKGVYTADDELATWVLMLEMLHKAERDGRDWDYRQSTAAPTAAGMAQNFLQSPMVVQVQKKERIWDEMPAAVQKPFATTTISHIIEMTALLGMIWKKFDQDAWSFRAEGNGMMVLSETVLGLGISVSFNITGKALFENQRIIPCPGVKDLLFGTVHTVYTDLHLQFEPTATSVGENRLTIQTLRRLKCDRKTINKYLARRYHIRSVVFEIIAMTSEVFRVRNSNFSRIPNPTPDLWRTVLSAYTLMVELQRNLSQLAASASPSRQIKYITALWQEKLEHLGSPEENHISIDMREAVHDVIEDCDVYLRGQEEVTLSVVRAHLTCVVDEVNDDTSFLSSHDCESEGLLIDYYLTRMSDHVIHFEKYQASKPISPSSPVRTLPRAQQRYNSLPDFAAEQRHDVWITLLFRMCCWWLLHDIDETDTLILPPSLKGSRLPVYIL